MTSDNANRNSSQRYDDVWSEVERVLEERSEKFEGREFDEKAIIDDYQELLEKHNQILDQIDDTRDELLEESMVRDVKKLKRKSRQIRDLLEDLDDMDHYKLEKDVEERVDTVMDNYIEDIVDLGERYEDLMDKQERMIEHREEVVEELWSEYSGLENEYINRLETASSRATKSIVQKFAGGAVSLGTGGVLLTEAPIWESPEWGFAGGGLALVGLYLFKGAYDSGHASREYGKRSRELKGHKYREDTPDRRER